MMTSFGEEATRMASPRPGHPLLRRSWQAGSRAVFAVLVLTTSVPAAVAQTPAVAPALSDTGFRFHGYLRSGFGVDGSGKGQQPFIAPLAGSKYRLGNEAETYLETIFAYDALSEGENPGYFDTQIRFAYVTPTSQSNTFATTFSLREAYALARRVWAAQPTATFWAGARFYDRYDVHLTDFWFRDPSGFGGGVEDIAIGGAKLALAWIGGTQDQLDPNGTVPKDSLFRFNKNTLDLRLYSLGVGRAVASVAIDLSHFNGDDVPTSGAPINAEDSFGVSATGVLDLPFTGGRNRFVLQYGNGAAFDFRSILTTPAGRTFSPGENVSFDDVWQFRVLNDFVIDERGPLALQAFALYQELENGAATDSRIRWTSLGARPVFRLGRFFSLATEAGWDYTEQGDQPGGSLVKLTVAPQIKPALKFFSRPSLRAFFTYAKWSDSFRGRVASVTNPTAVNGTAVGVQMEAWW